MRVHNYMSMCSGKPRRNSVKHCTKRNANYYKYIHAYINNAGMFAYVTVIWASPCDNIMLSYLLVLPQLFVFLMRIHFCLADCNINNKNMHTCKHIHICTYICMQMFCLFIVFNRVVSSHTSHSRLVSCPRNKNNKSSRIVNKFMCVCVFACVCKCAQTDVRCMHINTYLSARPS